MDPSGVSSSWRQPQIIRSVAVVTLAALGVVPALAAQLPDVVRADVVGADLKVGPSGDDAHAAGVPCVSCLVIGLDASVLDTAPHSSGSLDGVGLLVSDEGRDAKTTAEHVRTARNSGAVVAVLIAAPSEVRNRDEVLFRLRTTITELRAADADVQIVVDGDAFAAVGLPLEPLLPYVDAVVRGPARTASPIPGGPTWLRLPGTSNPSLQDLVRASLTTGGERVVLPVALIDWSVLQAFSARRPTVVEVTGARHLTAGEIVARHQARQRREDAVVQTTIATGSTTLLFQVPDFAAPVTITAETSIFHGPKGTNIEERDIRVNGASIAGGGASSAPELPLLEAERISTPPLVITLGDAYEYLLDGEETVGDTRCYVLSFKPRVTQRALVRGRAWIDTREFTLRRVETVQRDLHGAIVSSEQVDEFGPTTVAGTTVWLPSETTIFQSYEGAGFRTPVHRSIVVHEYEINSPTFMSRLNEAFASDNVMLRDTGDGLRYLVRPRGASMRSLTDRGSHTIRSVLGGVLVDPDISRPLVFAGLSYVNLDLFRRGAQLNVLFGGVFGQASLAVPAIAGTKWQVHGSVFGIGAKYTDRVFRNGRERYPENLLQRPGALSVGVLRPLTPRLRLTADYSLAVTALERTANTPPSFDVPPHVVDHGALLAVDADRGPWSARGWWNPVRRYRWRSWGLPGAFDPATRDYQRYGMRLTRTIALRSSVSSRLEASWVGGRDLDRFSRYGFDTFDNPLHGYPTSSIRYDRGAIVRTATAWTTHGLRVDAFADAAYVHDPGWASARMYPGVGSGIEAAGLFRTLWSVEWGYGIQAPRSGGGRGAHTARLTVYRGF